MPFTRLTSGYILFILLASLTSCFTVKPLRFEKVENVTVNKSSDQTQISFDLTGHNPNNWSFKLTELQTKVSIGGESFVNLQANNVMRLKRGADFSIPVTVKAPPEDLMKLLSSGLAMLLRGDKISLDVKGDFILKKFLFRKKFSYELNEKIDPGILKGFH